MKKWMINLYYSYTCSLLVGKHAIIEQWLILRVKAANNEHANFKIDSRSIFKHATYLPAPRGKWDLFWARVDMFAYIAC